MSLNITSSGTHELVRRLAASTGQSMTSAVEDAVRRRLMEVEATSAGAAAGRSSEVVRLLDAFRAGLSAADRAALRASQEQMFDDAGLPR